MICDLHVHTHFSCDSKVLMDEYCQYAIQHDVTYICFTDHIDNNKHDEGYGLYNAEAYFEEFEKTKEKYSGKLNLLCGIEFSEPHIYQAEFEKHAALPYDFIIGSVHFCKDNMFMSEMVKSQVPVEVCYENYWREVQNAVSYGGFDCFGHLDFPKRYYKQLLYDKGSLGEIFSTMLKNGIIPEINTSSLRRGLDETLPDEELLRIYKAVGGQFVTVGSDAHYVKDLSADCSYAKDLIQKFDFKEVIFHKRKLKLIGS